MPRITIPASQMSRLAMTIAGGGDGSYDKAYSQELMSQSSIGKAIEEANLARQKAQQYEDQNAARQPDAVLDNALVGFGIPTDARDDVKNVIKSGRLPDKYQPLPTDQAGPVLPKPDWMDKMGGLARQIMTVQNALTLGDKNVENVAKAYGTYDNINKQDQVINGALPASSLGRAVAASKGTKLVDNIGDTGQGYDMFSGDGVTLDQGLRDVFGNKANAQIRKENAQAGAANASAAHSLASRDKVRQEIADGVKTGQIAVITDNEGRVSLLNKVTGVSRPATSEDGIPLKGKSTADKPMTESQAKDNGYGSRMLEADRILNELAGKYSPAAVNTKVMANDLPIVGGLAGAAANWALPAEAQQVEQAQRDFINAVLRRESGAAISPSEFANANKQYFDQPNDKPEVRAQKARNRKLATEGVLASVPMGKRGLPSLTNQTGNQSGRVVSVDY